MKSIYHVHKVQDEDGLYIIIKGNSEAQIELKANDEIQKGLLAGYRYPAITKFKTSKIHEIRLNFKQM